MFGQTRESLAGHPANEPRTAPYRNIFQAYGTYAFPPGKGLNVDFGRFANSLVFEGTLAKDQINYSRSLLFTALMGEGDYIVSRLYSNSTPVHLASGAGYLKYQFAPSFSLAGRFEYMSDRGGFLSGATQALKEIH